MCHIKIEGKEESGNLEVRNPQIISFAQFVTPISIPSSYMISSWSVLIWVFLPAPPKFFLHLQTFFKFPKDLLTI